MANADHTDHLHRNTFQTPDPGTRGLAAVQNIRLPPFWPNNPRVWLMQFEAQFRLRHITKQETKFLHTVSVLPSDVAEEMAGVLAAPDPISPFVG